MHNDVNTLPEISRRTLLKGAAGLGIGALLMAVPAGLEAGRAPRYQSTTSVAAYDAAVATAWYRLALQLVQQTPGFTPPVGSRAFGYIGVTLYEALVPGMPRYRSLSGQLNELRAAPYEKSSEYHWPTVANSALATSMRHFFPGASPENVAGIDNLEKTLATDLARDMPAAVIRRSTMRGKAVADHIYDWSLDDGGHEGHANNFPSSYVPPVGAGLWIPTAPGFATALQPSWGQNRPFVLASGAEFEPGAPPKFSTTPGSAFYSEALEVYEAVENLTEEQHTIALFWSDDAGKTVTPPGHAISIMTQVLEKRRASLSVAAEAYAKAGIAVADGIISCWNAKYQYNLVRPISYIQAHIDAGWGVEDRALPVTTPPFPEYTSGHSVQTAAFAHVLYDMFGDMPFTDHTHDARGLAPRTFTSCRAMAEETAISRLYGGIHYRSAIEHGIEQGKEIGRRVSALTFETAPVVPEWEQPR